MRRGCITATTSRLSATAFQVTRNNNLYLAEEESRNLLESVRTELHNRRKGDAVRLEIEADADPEVLSVCALISSWNHGRFFGEWASEFVEALFNIYEQTEHAGAEIQAV